MPLTSRERSGTPHETRGAAGAAGLSIEDLFSPGRGAGIGGPSPFLRLGNQAQQNLLGTEFGGQSLRDVLGGVLADPTDQTQGLFKSLEPFEARETERQVGGLRGSLGSLGGRFSRNLLGAETGLRGRLGEGFERTRQQGLLQANQQRISGLGTVLQGLLGAQGIGSQLTGQALGFAQPGPPVIEQGLLPGLIQAGGNLGQAAILSRALGSRPGGGSSFGGGEFGFSPSFPGVVPGTTIGGNTPFNLFG